MSLSVIILFSQAPHPNFTCAVPTMESKELQSRKGVLIIYTAAIATTVLGANCAKENQLADN